MDEDRDIFNAMVVLICMISAAVMILVACEVKHQKTISSIVGEAADQGLHGMVCVAEVIRTRGSLDGFYGQFNPMVKDQPAWVFAQAEKAWRISARTNYTKGATHFENVKKFGTPKWSKSMKVFYRYRDHVFFGGLYEKAQGD